MIKKVKGTQKVNGSKAYGMIPEEWLDRIRLIIE